ncbi:hypothetical protein [Streptomyces triculaminicus]|uniref:hypothetical protein n=1 Tax=Streptomyces triculaminicus TaxID=2816232 RepID=UPI0037A106D4
MSDHDNPQEKPAEHRRFAVHLNELEQVGEADETDLVEKVLADPDRTMAQSAVLRHLDRRAADLHPAPAYETWAESMAQATSRYPLLARRLREWSLFRAVALGLPWHPDALLDASDWLQLRAAATSDTADRMPRYRRPTEARRTQVWSAWFFGRTSSRPGLP